MGNSIYNRNNKQRLKTFSDIKKLEFFYLLLFIFIAFILVYFVDARLNRLLFLIILPIVWFSKRDYLWVAFFFILMEMPGGLFSGGLRNDPYRLPIYSFAPGFSFAIHELFILVIFAKTLLIKRIRNSYLHPFFQRELKILFILFIVLILISPLLGMSINSLSNVFKLSIALTLFYSLFRLINTEEQLNKFLKIMFPFAFVALALQVYGLINGEQLIALVKPGISSAQGSYNVSDKQGAWVRPIEMGHVMLITFSGSLWLLLRKHSDLGKQYLVSINLLSFLVIFLTGTRTWIIAFSLGYVIFFFLAGNKMPKILIRSIIVVVGFIILINTIPVINKQIKNSWSRVATVEKVIEGDVTGGGTISRYDVRAPKVMEGFFSSSIILGAGFSDHFFRYADGHVGYHNILLNAGIVGFLIFLFTIWKVLQYPFKLTAKYNHLNKQFIRTSIIPLAILLIINIGTQTIGFTPDGVNRIVLMAFSLIMIDIAVKSNFPVLNLTSK